MELETLPNVTKVSKDTFVQMKYDGIIAMRLLGLKYNQIGEKVGFSETHIKRLLGPNGKLHDRLNQAIQKVGEEGITEALMILFANLPDVARTMVVTAKQAFTPSGVIAGKSIFEYTIGQPRKRQAKDLDRNQTTADLVLRVTLRRKKQIHDSGAGRTISEGMAG